MGTQGLFLYRPSYRAKGQVEYNLFDQGLQNVDTELYKRSKDLYMQGYKLIFDYSESIYSSIQPGGPITNLAESTLIIGSSGGARGTALKWTVQGHGEVTPLLMYPPDPLKAPFVLTMGENLFNGTYDDVMYFGYNVFCGGDRVLSTEPKFVFVIEQDYLTLPEGEGGVHTLESYFEWGDKAGVPQTRGSDYRPLMWRFNRDTGAMLDMKFSSSGVIFSDWDVGFAYAKLYASLNNVGLELNGITGQTVNTILAIKAQGASYAGQIDLYGKTTFSLMSNPDTNSFSIKYGSVKSMTWLEGTETVTGYVGIGIETPTKQFHIAVGNASNDLIELQWAPVTGNELVGIAFARDLPANIFARILAPFYSGGGGLAFATGGVGSPVERVRIDNDGYVGIGTSVPKASLHLCDTGASKNLLQIQYSPVTGNEEKGIVFTRDGGLTTDIFAKILPRYESGGGGLGFYTGATNAAIEHLKILKDGKVGIGMTPHSNLAVTGLPIYADNAAAITGGLAAGDFYRNNSNPDNVCVVH